MAKINLSRMDFASLITLRKQVENTLLNVVPRLKSSWQR